MNTVNDTIKNQLEAKGYDYAVAVATQAEIEAGAACGQLSIITEEYRFTSLEVQTALIEKFMLPKGNVVQCNTIEKDVSDYGDRDPITIFDGITITIEIK